jgi:hypothetical protein
VLVKHPLIFIIAIVFTGLTACKKMQVAEVNTAISIDESASMIAGLLSSNTNGLNNLITDITAGSKNLYLNGSGCGITFTDSVSRQSMPDLATAFNFKHKITNKLNCNTNKALESITSLITCSGQYKGPKLIVHGNGIANTTVTGLGAESSVYTLNGQIKNMGSFKIKADTTRKGTIAIQIALKDLTIIKATTLVPAVIASGTATATVTGNSSKGAFLFEGTLTFNGFNDATLILSKETFSINLITGAVIKR